MVIDTHCHLSKKYYDNIDFIVSENRKNGIEKIIISGCELDDMEEAIELSLKYDDVYLSLGFHPSEAGKVNNEDLLYLEKQLARKKIVAIGEIGLDYYYGKDFVEEQIMLFEYQLQLAEKLNLPVIIHSRDATKDTIDILKKYSVRGVIHCFSGSLEIAKEYIKMGFLLGIGGVITFKNSNLPTVVSKIGFDFLVLETDSPYLTPAPYRGKKNSSKYIPLIAAQIADSCQCSMEDVMVRTTENACSLFDFS